MKPLLCTLGLILTVTLGLPAFAAEGDSLWSCTYGGNNDEFAHSIIETSDGGFLLAGYTSSFGSGSRDMWLVKTDAQGDSLWSRTFGGINSDEAHSVIETSDGSFLLAGRTYRGSGETDMWLIKTDTQGNSLWSNTFGGESWEEAYSVIETSDGGFLLAGYTSSFGSGSRDMWLIKTNDQGDSLWARTFGGNYQEVAYSVIETSGGGFLLAGYTTSFGSGAEDMWLVKTNAQGDSLWSRIFGGNTWDIAYDVIETNDGGLILAGWTASFGSCWSDVWLVKTDAQGDSLWSNIFGGSGHEYAKSVIETGDGNFLLAGYTNSFGAGDLDMWLVCAEGALQPDIEMSAARLNFGRVTIGEQADLPLTVYNIGNGTLVLYDIFCNLMVFSSNWNPSDSLVLPGDSLELTVTFTPDDTVIFTDSLFVVNNSGFCHVDLIGKGNMVPGIGQDIKSAIPKEFALRQPYPNPFNPTTVIIYQLPMAREVKLLVYDISGQIMARLVHGWREVGTHEVIFDGSRLASGIYLASLQAGDFSQIQKMALVK